MWKILTAHDVIICDDFDNYYSAKVFHKNKSGIFRTAKIGRTVIIRDFQAM